MDVFFRWVIFYLSKYYKNEEGGLSFYLLFKYIPINIKSKYDRQVATIEFFYILERNTPGMIRLIQLKDQEVFRF